MHKPEPLDEIRLGFFAECEDLLERLLDALADPCLMDPTHDAIHQAFRAVHTIKGGAASLGFDVLMAEAHGFENRLDQIRTGAAMPDARDLSALLAAADKLSAEVTAAAEDQPARKDGAPVTPALPANSAPGVWTVRFKPSAALYATGNEPLHILNALAASGSATVHCDLTALPGLEAIDPEAGYLVWTVRLPGDLPEATLREAFDFVDDLCDLSIARRRPGATPAKNTAPVAPGATTVRVELPRVDRLMNLVGELVISQSILASTLADAGHDRRSPPVLAFEAQALLVRELQDAVMAIRTQPIKPLFLRMARVLREAAAKLGKSARLVCEGDTTEVDRAIVEQLAEPLTHMIRNAVDHGLEPPARRRANGKSETGDIRLVAANRAGRFIIELADDGAGIDRPRVREIATARGLIAPHQTLNDMETDALLFQPGFSTARELTAHSGRGVGMDVVRSTLGRIGGRISIASTPGAGTRFTLSLPLTLAILDGLLVSVAGQTLVIPLASALETALVGDAGLRHDLSGRTLVRIRDRHVPLVDAGQILRLGAPAEVDRPDGVTVLIADEEDRRIALVVDDILEQTQVVIKDLISHCGPVPGIAAATILGDGRVALILDPGALVRMACGPGRMADPTAARQRKTG